MHIIDTVTMEGFWGDRTLSFKLNEDVNFIIGMNGSGKTTAVNLIVAALTADFNELDRHDFSKITIKLKTENGRKKPSVTVIKTASKDTPFATITYEIKESSTDKAIVLSLDDYEEQMMLRRYPMHIVERELYRRHGRNASETLKRLVNVSWLSVHRSNIEKKYADEDKNESTVDKKLKELSNRLVRYFSSLGKQGSELLENFQKTVFLSMLHRRSNKPLFSTVRDIDLEEEKKVLEGIFSQFKFTTVDFQGKLDGHFDALKKAKERLSEAPNTLSTTDVSVLIGTERIDYIVDEWKKLLKKRAEIFEPRDTYLDIVNSMMQRKKFRINDQNELNIKTQSGKDLPIHRLSSGEKQLLIVLGEALLQEKNYWVYIADEPELSLHVKWQEALVPNLRAINPNSQIIFATHSPDVVSVYDDKVFDMERML
ncbi:AAA family ATPase [Pseudomonas aeruginosa]|uniref:AAA family ATPase n=1 Tax=Pseudomonas aeruginosa TaxID=287 RepID=UPI003D80AD7E